MASSISLQLLAIFAALYAAQPSLGEAILQDDAQMIAALVRETVRVAKGGIMLNTLQKEIEQLESGALAPAFEKIANEVSECETNLVMKMAAQRTGSHEVLSVLVADDAFAVLSGRLGLALAMLDDVAAQMGDAASRGDDVTGHLAALTFLCQTTTNVIRTADEAAKTEVYGSEAKAGVKSTGSETATGSGASRVRRQSIDLGGGFGLGGNGLSWTNKGGSFSVYGGPKIKLQPIRVDGWNIGVTIRF